MLVELTSDGDHKHYYRKPKC